MSPENSQSVLFQLAQRITIVETLMRERNEETKRRDDETRAELAEIKKLALSAAKEGREGREMIISRLEKFEKRYELDAHVGEKLKEAADTWRSRVYAVLRFLLPPGIAATIAIAIWERLN